MTLLPEDLSELPEATRQAIESTLPESDVVDGRRLSGIAGGGRACDGTVIVNGIAISFVGATSIVVGRNGIYSSGGGGGSASRPDGRVRGGAGSGGGGGGASRDDWHDGTLVGRDSAGNRLVVQDGRWVLDDTAGNLQAISLSESDRHRQQQERAAESAQHRDLEAVQAWCDENGWTEPELVDGRWWGFESGAVMPTQIPWLPNQQVSEAEFWRRLRMVLSGLTKQPIRDFRVEYGTRFGFVDVLTDGGWIKTPFLPGALGLTLCNKFWRSDLVQWATTIQQAIEPR